MTRSAAALVSLAGFAAVLIACAISGARRTHNAGDFLLGSRRTGVWLTALSYTGNATSAWMLLGLAAAAFSWGWSALWVWLAALLGCSINWFLVAPRLRVLSGGQGSVTFLQVLAADAGDRLLPLVTRSAAFMLLAALLLQAGAQLHLIGAMFATDFGFNGRFVAATAATLAVACTVAGGYRTASLNDATAAIVMLAVAAFLPLPALVAAGDWEGLRSGFAALGATELDAFGGRSGVVALAFAVGVLGLGLAMPGQPHVDLRFMAARDESVLRRARWIALVWVALVCGAVLLCGWSAKVLYAGLERPELALFAIGNRLLPPFLAAFLAVAILAAVLGNLASQCLTAAATLAVDLRRPLAPLSLPLLRAALAGFAVLVVCTGTFAPGGWLEHSFFPMTALGAAFGPLLLVRLTGKRVRPGSTLGAMWAGFVLCVLFHLLPDSPGDFLERVLPFVAALGIALSGGERRRNPDRADRSQEAVHDRVPI